MSPEKSALLRSASESYPEMLAALLRAMLAPRLHDSGTQPPNSSLLVPLALGVVLASRYRTKEGRELAAELFKAVLFSSVDVPPDWRDEWAELETVLLKKRDGSAV